jgi:D-inositol-3-phosphate glycosyltransferase
VRNATRVEKKSNPDFRIVQLRKVVHVEADQLRIAMLSVHSSPIGKLGTNDTGGMSVCIREVAKELGSRGHLVDIFTRLNDPGCDERLALYKNVRLVHLRAGNDGPMDKLAVYPHLGDFFEALEVFRKREGIHYDLIHSHYWLSGHVGNWAQREWSAPHIVTFHTLGAAKNDTFGVEQEPELRVTTETHLARNAQRILAGTTREKEQLMSYYGAASDSIGVVPCGVNLNLFHPVDKLKTRRELDFDHNESLVLYVGRFAPSKGSDRLIAAMSHLRNLPHVRLLIVGGDGHHAPEVQNLHKLSRELGIQENVTFVGSIDQEELPRYYNAADILVVPSRYESFGLVALESLACGTPVVATPVGAVGQILREGETGHVVQNGSPRLLADGIKALISGRNTLSADLIRESILEFGWPSVASAMIEEYATVVRRHQMASNS